MPLTVFRLASTAVTVAVTVSDPALFRVGALSPTVMSLATLPEGGAGSRPGPPKGAPPLPPPHAETAKTAKVARNR
jgi:hypothetical protein